MQRRPARLQTHAHPLHDLHGRHKGDSCLVGHLHTILFVFTRVLYMQTMVQVYMSYPFQLNKFMQGPEKEATQCMALVATQGLRLSGVGTSSR